MKKILITLLVIVLPISSLALTQGIFTKSLVNLKIQSLAPVPTPQTINVQFGGALGIIYSPANIYIHPGDHVVWQGDFTSHPLVSDVGAWTTVNTGTQFEFIFTHPGVYPFHCFFHGPLGMKGAVNVGFFDYLPDVGK